MKIDKIEKIKTIKKLNMNDKDIKLIDNIDNDIDKLKNNDNNNISLYSNKFNIGNSRPIVPDYWINIKQEIIQAGKPIDNHHWIIDDKSRKIIIREEITKEALNILDVDLYNNNNNDNNKIHYLLANLFKQNDNNSLPMAPALIKDKKIYYLICKTNSREFRVAMKAGFEYNKEIRYPYTMHVETAAALAAYAAPSVQKDFHKIGIPQELLKYLRFAPALIPCNNQWTIAASTTSHTPHPGYPWKIKARNKRKTGFYTNSYEAAYNLIHMAPRPLADGMLKAEHKDIGKLNTLKKQIKNLIKDESREVGGNIKSVERTKYPFHYCIKCNSIYATKANTNKLKLDRCKDNYCSSNNSKIRYKINKDKIIKNTQSIQKTLSSMHRKCDPESWRRYAEYNTKFNNITRSNNIDTDKLIPSNEKYLKFQKDAVEFCKNKAVSLLALPTGCGKTIIASAIINLNTLNNKKNILILCPASLVPKWKNDEKRWKIINNNNNYKWKIMAYTQVHKITNNINNNNNIKYDLVVLDESHLIKNHKAKRTKAMMKIEAEQFLFMTATPIYNRPIDLYPYLFKLSKNFNHKKNFARAYELKNLKLSEQSRRDKDLMNETAEFLKNFMFRKDRDEVLIDLPEKKDPILIPVVIAKADEIRKQEIELLESLKNTAKNKTAIFAQLQALRKFTAQQKLPALIEEIQLLSETNEQFLTFSHHRDITDELLNAMHKFNLKAKPMHGGITPEERSINAKLFQQGKLQALACSMTAAGVGIDLFKASHVIFAELDWSPATLIQAEARAWRYGQTNSLTTKIFIAKDTIDEYLGSTMAHKHHSQAITTGDLSPEALLKKIISNK